MSARLPMAAASVPPVTRTAPRVAVIGAGLMGHGIAQVFAASGSIVSVQDPSSAMRESLNERIAGNLRLAGQDPKAADNVTACTRIGEAASLADLVIEAAPENLELKQALFAEIEEAAGPQAILASNTSVIPITRIMERLNLPGRALGTHWWNPPHLIPLVEVVATAQTHPDTIVKTIAWLREAGKTAIEVRKDIPGFIGNRLQHALWREAIALVAEGVCDAETIDTVVKASFGRRLGVIGPLENADLVGTDLTLAIHEQVLHDLDRAQAPHPLLRQMVAEGRLGMKSGQGFRRWTQEQQDGLRARLAETLLRAAREDALA